MDDINSILTAEEKAFIKQHNISLSDIYDARTETYCQYRRNAKNCGCHFVVQKCIYGHRLKDRSGHCIVCNPAYIAFQNRESGKGIVYIAKNGSYCKVGMIENKRKADRDLLAHREYQLNSEDGYGGMIGWKIVKSWTLDKYAGKVERETHKLLREHLSEKPYWYSGELRTTKEMFKCSVQKAEEAIMTVLRSNQ